MANTFKNALVALPNTSAATLYTCPAMTTAIIHSLYIPNIDGTNPSTITVEAIKSGPTTVTLTNALTVPAGNTLVFPKPINLIANESVRLTAGHANRLSGFASVLEITSGEVSTTNTFKNATGIAGTSATSIYTCPAATAAVLHTIQLSNYEAGDVRATIEVTDSSAAVTTKLAFTVLVPANETLVLDKPVNLEANDILKVTSDTATSLYAFISVLEIA